MKPTSTGLNSKRVVGVREAKTQLSRLLRDVQRGQDWTITERGKPIARLVPIAQGALALVERIRRLEEVGVIERAPQRRSAVPPPLPVQSGIARRMLDDERSGSV